MDPINLALTGGTVLGTADLMKRLLGPTFDHYGQQLRDYVAERGCRNVNRIAEHAVHKLGNRLEKPGGVSPKVWKTILQEGSFCEDALTAEYFGGVLASSRSGVSRDDRGAKFAALVANLSVYELRAHYIFYCLFKKHFAETPLRITVTNESNSLILFIPGTSFSSAMDLSSDEDFNIILTHVMNNLHSASLVGDRNWRGPAETMRRITPPASGSGLALSPSPNGVELFLWAIGRGDVGITEFFSSDFDASANFQIAIPPDAEVLSDRKDPILMFPSGEDPRLS